MSFCGAEDINKEEADKNKRPGWVIEEEKVTEDLNG
jgi:hypothetical protein